MTVMSLLHGGLDDPVARPSSPRSAETTMRPAPLLLESEAKSLGVGLGRVDGNDRVEAPEVLHELLRVLGRVQARPAGAEGHVPDLGQGFDVGVEAPEQDPVRRQPPPEAQGPGDGLRLLQALLERPVLVGVGGELDGLIGGDLRPGQVQGAPVRVEDSNLSVLHADEVLGVAVEGRGL